MTLQFLNEISNQTFSDFKQIGSGSYSTIFSATHVPTNSRVALKISLKNDDEEYMKLLYQELDIQKSLNHPFICRYFMNFETEHLIVIVLELIEGINLLDYVNKNKGLKPSEAQNIFSQLIIAVEYLHNECNISHRDLKLENVMLDLYGHIRLIDFGFSSQKQLMTTICGSVPYCAPEVLECQEYTHEADIWSLGIILYCLISGHLPFYHQNISKLACIICRNDPTYPSTFGPLARDLVSRLLIKDPSLRITIEEIKDHAFISNSSIFQINYKKLFSPRKASEDDQINDDNKVVDTVQNAQIEEPNLIIPKIQPSLMRRFSQIDGISQIPPIAKRASNIKFSNSNPNIGNDKLGNILPMVRQRRKFSLNTNIAMNSALISNLQKRVTLDTDNIDDLIIQLT